jgi:hypothetical protein
VRVSIEDSLAVGRCGCAGYASERGSYGPPPVLDIVEPRLARPGNAELSGLPSLAPVRDLFDESDAFRPSSDPRGVPWRPSS